MYTPTAFREERALWRQVIQLNIVRSVRIITDALSDGRRYNRDDSGAESEDTESSVLPREIELLKMRLAPLRHTEITLISQLVPHGEEEPTHLGTRSIRSVSGSGRSRSQSGSDTGSPNEISVRPGSTWSSPLAAITNRNGRDRSLPSINLKTKDSPQDVLNACRRDIQSLWNDPVVRHILKKKKIRLEEHSGL